MCSPTAVLVTNVPMPARVLPNQSRANAGLTRRGVRSTKCERREWSIGAGASGPGGASVTERNYATAKVPEGAGRHASTSRSREPSRTHTHRPSAVRRATWVRTVPSAVVDVVMARSPLITARELTAAPLAAQDSGSHRGRERLADGDGARRLATARKAHDGVGGIQPHERVEVARGDAGGETGLEGLRGVSPDGGRVGGRRHGHTVPPATDSAAICTFRGHSRHHSQGEPGLPASARGRRC